MMKRMMVVVVGSVMALSSTLVWAGAASNVEATNITTIQSGDNTAKTTTIGGSNVDASANAGAVSISSEAKGDAKSSVEVNKLTTIQSGDNTATTTVIGGSNVKAEANANAVDIESKATK